MAEIFNILIGIVILFFILLVFKQLLPGSKKKNFCVICTSISLTWMTLILLYYLKIFEDILIIAILMGTSIAGIYYLIESKVREEMKIFRLPFFLTLIFAAYNFINWFSLDVKSLTLLIFLWLVFISVYLFSSNKRIGSFVNKLIECCKRW